MKIKTTRKHINTTWANVYRAGYCDLQYIMRGSDPTYYNAGVYGWNWDAYTDYRTNSIITTGYRNMVGETVPEELIEKYTKRAKEICKRVFTSETEKEFDQLRRDFWDELDNYKIWREQEAATK